MPSQIFWDSDFCLQGQGTAAVTRKLLENFDPKVVQAASKDIRAVITW